MNKSKIKVILAFTVLIALACVCSGTPSTPPVKIGESTSLPTLPPAAAQSYKTGDIIQVKDGTITMEQAGIQGNTVRAVFTFENKGSEETTISSLMSFSAKDKDGTNLEIQLDCDGGGMDGTVLPGDKLKGSICWSGVVTNAVKIYFVDGFFNANTVVWEISP
jgi:hypothetical protein